MNKKNFRILSIDGGGIRGIYSAHILKRIEEENNIKIKDYFDLIVGTSTGSIIAAAIACDIDLSKVVNLYKNEGKQIFCSSFFDKLPIINQIAFCMKSKYNHKNLKKIITEIFSDKRMKDIEIPLILPATDITNCKVHVTKSAYHGEFVRDPNKKIVDAIISSCSAPTFFEPYKCDEYLLADGGLWANNPSLIGVIDAKYRRKIDLNDIKVLSIGTGLYKPCYPFNKEKKWWKIDRRWGFLNGWGHKKLLDLVLSLQSQSVCNYVNLLLGFDNVKRIDFDSGYSLPLDKVSEVDGLIAKADAVFTEKAMEIKDFLEINKE